MSKIEHPTKPTIKSVRFKAISHFQFFFYFAKLEGKKLRKKPLVFPIPISSPDLTWFREDSGKPTPPLEFSTNISKSLAVNHYSSWKPSWVFQGSFFELLVVFIFVGKKKPEWTGTPSIGGVERWFRPRTLAFARRPCRGYMGPPMRWWKISRWKMMATYIYTYIYIYIWYVCSCLNGFQFLDVKYVSEAG